MIDHDPLFDSAWLKWAWAIRHCNTLQADIDATLKAHPDPVRRLRADYQPKRHGFAVVIKEIDPPPVRWQLALGDIANNCRSALDHLAWALVCRGRTPPGSGRLTPAQEKAVYFPFCENRSEFNAQIRDPPNAKALLKLPGVRRADSAVVRRAQPYYCGPRLRPEHPLVLLARINVGDKHRGIHPVWAWPKSVDIEVTRMRDCVTRETKFWRRRPNALDVDAEVAFIPARRRGDDPELEVKGRFATTPTLAHRISVFEWYTRTTITLFKLLREFSAQPPSIHELNVEWAVRLPG